MASTLVLDPMTFGFVPAVPVVAKANMQGGSMLERMVGSHPVASACQVGLVSAGAACDMMMLHLVRSRIRARSSPSAAAPQQLQPPTVEKPMKPSHRFVRWAAQRLPHQVREHMLQLPLITAFVAFIGLCCASKRRRQLKLKSVQDKQFENNKFETNFVPRKYQEHEEPDAEPQLRRGNSDLSQTSRYSSKVANDGRPLVPAKMLLPTRRVASAANNPEDKDVMDNSHGPVPGTAGFVAEQTAEVERVLQIYRMYTEGSVQLVDEEGTEELIRQSQVVPGGLVRSATSDLERKISARKVVSFA